MNLSGMRITVMGLGVHGGGLAAARYAVSRGATVTVTDLRSYDLLKNSADELPGQCRVVLGRHERDDFVRADMVIKNPAVPRTAPLLADTAAVTSDIALFLAERETLSAGDRSGVSPLITVTGTKGKSTCSSLAAHIVAGAYPETMLGGNITVSPLSFLDTLKPADPVVLELSSFQLGDLAFFRSHNARSGARIPHTLPRTVFFPAISATVAIITNIFTDHQDYYPSMEAYVEDKREIYRHLPPDALVILPKDNQWTPSFIEELSTHFPDNPRLPCRSGR